MPGQPNTAHWATFDLRSQSIQVTAGMKYAIAFSGQINWALSPWLMPTPDYQGGEFYWRQRINIHGDPQANDGDWILQDGPYYEGKDLYFRTYVTPVPEASTYMLAVFGAVAGLLTRRTRATK